MNIKKFFQTSWKTTVSGVAAAVAAWANAIAYQFDSFDATEPDWGFAVTMTLMAIGLITARDNNKTSESQKAK